MKRLVRPSPGSSQVAATDPDFMGDYPHLCQFLTERFYDDDGVRTDREPGSLSVWCSDGLFRAKLNDKDSGYCCYVAGQSWADLWSAADHACSDPEAGWKPDANGASRTKKK